MTDPYIDFVLLFFGQFLLRWNVIDYIHLYLIIINQLSCWCLESPAEIEPIQNLLTFSTV